MPITVQSLGVDLSRLGDYVRDFGDTPALRIGDQDQHVILGLGEADDAANAVTATFGARVVTRGRLPRTHLVIEVERDGSIVALNSMTGAVHVWRSPEDDAVLAESYATYMRELKERVAHFDRGYQALAAHIEALDRKYSYDRRGNGTLPKDREWRPYRSCIQDVIVGATVIRYQPSGNCLEVDVFLTAEIPELEELTGARALTMFILGEAVRCGTTLEIRFTTNVEGGRVPAALRSLAERHAVEVGQLDQALLSPGESSSLLFSLAGLQQGTIGRIAELNEAGSIIAEQLCYGVIEGSWSIHELAVLLAAPAPQRVLLGEASPWDTMAHSEDRLYGSTAVLAGRFVQTLARSSVALRERPDAAASETAEGGTDAWHLEETEDLTVELDTDADPGRVSLLVEPHRKGDDLLFESPLSQTGVIRAQRLEVLPRPLAEAELPAQIERDVALLREQPRDDGTIVVILAPGDLHILPESEKDRLVELAASVGAVLVADQGRLVEIGEEAERRIARIRNRLAS